jgi:hypothetical protein
MTFHQKIQCNVHECSYNNVDDSMCTLEKIQVTPCGTKGNKTPEDETACAMYSYSGEPDEEESEDDTRG